MLGFNGSGHICDGDYDSVYLASSSGILAKMRIESFADNRCRIG